MALTGTAKALIRLTGDKTLAAKMNRLASNLQNKVAKPAVTKAIRYIAKAQKAAAQHPVVKASIGSRVGKFRNALAANAGRTQMEVTGKAGINVGKKPAGRLNKKTGKIVKGSAQQPIAHLLTMGSRPRWTGATTRAKGMRGKLVSTGKAQLYRGQMKEHKFLAAATKSAWPQARNIAAQSAKGSIEEIMKQ